MCAHAVCTCTCTRACVCVCWGGGGGAGIYMCLKITSHNVTSTMTCTQQPKGEPWAFLSGRNDSISLATPWRQQLSVVSWVSVRNSVTRRRRRHDVILMTLSDIIFIIFCEKKKNKQEKLLIAAPSGHSARPRGSTKRLV